MIADELFVVARWADADAVFVGGPVARRIRGQHFVHHVQAAIGVGAEFELGIGQQDPAFGGVGGGVAVEAQGRVADLFCQFGAHGLDHGVEVDVLVVVAYGRLGRWREDRFGQLFGLFQPVGQGDAADPPGALVVLPAAADQIAAGDGFHRHRLEPAGDHRALRVQRGVDAGRQHAGHVDAGQVVAQDVRGLVEPEIADLAEHLALAGDRVGQHHVEGAEPVGGHDQQQRAVLAGFGRQCGRRQVEHVADLAAMAQGQAGQVGFKQSGRHAQSVGIGRAA